MFSVHRCVINNFFARFIDDGIFSSFDIVSLVGELNDAFDIDITPVDIVPENFNSAEAMWEMIQRLQD